MNQDTDKAIVKKHNLRKRIFFSLLGFLALIAIVFFVYTAGYSKATPEAIAILSDPALTIQETKQYYTLAPVGRPTTTGFIFYPGGKVDEKAYLPLLANLSKKGFFCVLIRAPFHLSILNDNAAQGVLQNFPTISAWAVGGHSLGGVSASNFAYKSNSSVQGLVLLASYPLKDFSTSPLTVLSITGDKDEVLNWQNYEEAIPLLPPSTTFLTISGANHGQFGEYGSQKGDGVATITPQQQREQVAQAIAILLTSLTPSTYCSFS